MSFLKCERCSQFIITMIKISSMNIDTLTKDYDKLTLFIKREEKEREEREEKEREEKEREEKEKEEKEREEKEKEERERGRKEEREEKEKEEKEREEKEKEEKEREEKERDYEVNCEDYEVNCDDYEGEEVNCDDCDDYEGEEVNCDCDDYEGEEVNCEEVNYDAYYSDLDGTDSGESGESLGTYDIFNDTKKPVIELTEFIHSLPSIYDNIDALKKISRARIIGAVKKNVEEIDKLIDDFLSSPDCKSSITHKITNYYDDDCGRELKRLLLEIYDTQTRYNAKVNANILVLSWAI